MKKRNEGKVKMNNHEFCKALFVKLVIVVYVEGAKRKMKRKVRERSPLSPNSPNITHASVQLIPPAQPNQHTNIMIQQQKKMVIFDCSVQHSLL